MEKWADLIWGKNTIGEPMLSIGLAFGKVYIYLLQRNYGPDCPILAQKCAE